jgi:hypothetical protein
MGAIFYKIEEYVDRGIVSVENLLKYLESNHSIHSTQEKRAP